MRLLVNLAMRIFGPCKSPNSATKRPWRAAMSRTNWARARCSSGVPWEKFRRATSSPARIIFSSTTGELLAGPRVATILVRREVIQCSFFRMVGRLLCRAAVVIVGLHYSLRGERRRALPGIERAAGFFDVVDKLES